MTGRLTRFHHRLVTQGPTGLFDYIVLIGLIPFSVLYGSISYIRNYLYSIGLISVYKPDIPVISVGNITAGGTGKTPFVDYLLKHIESAGLRPAVVSRGYGGSFSGRVGVVSDGKGIRMSAREAGDEPCLLARRNPLCPVVIAPKRAEAVKYLQSHSMVDVVVMDDGFQHRALERDINIVLLDARRPFGNGWCLPAGNLREFRTGLGRADLLVKTKCEDNGIRNLNGYDTYLSRYELAEVAIGLDGVEVPLKKLKGKKLKAFSGIADTGRFFADLEQKGLSVGESVAFEDHVDYRQSEVLERLKDENEGVDALITTEKDAVKLSGDMFELPCYYVPISIRVEDSESLLATVFDGIRRNR